MVKSNTTCASAQTPIKKNGCVSKAETALQKWKRLGPSWRTRFLIESTQPEHGSWLDFDGAGFGCRVCKFTGLTSPFGTYSVNTPQSLQAVNFDKHAKAKNHRAAVAGYLLGAIDEGLGAPSREEYLALISKIEKGQATLGSQKEAQMTWTLAEAMKSLDQEAVAKCATITLFRDESKGRLLLRFRTVSPTLETYAGTAGQARDFGTGSLNIVNATQGIIKRFSSRWQAAPGKVKKDHFLKPKLYKKFVKSVRIITTDSAADEMLAGEMMRSKVLSCMSTQLTPNLQFVLRDGTHGSRRLVSRGWAADPYLTNVIDNFVRTRKAIARTVHNSLVVRAKFKSFAKTSFRVVRTHVTNMRAAPHRYESMQKPLGRSTLYFHATVRTALWCHQTRDDEAGKNATHWLNWIDSEKALQSSMMSDASDQTMVITRLNDNENVDGAVLTREVKHYLNTIDQLFGKDARCLEVFGYTKTMLDTLSKPLVFTVGKRVRSIGFDGPFPRDIIDRCLARMRAWTKLMYGIISVEFPYFEICYVLLVMQSLSLRVKQPLWQGVVSLSCIFIFCFCAIKPILYCVVVF